MRLTTVLRRLLGVIRMHVKDAHLGNTGPLTVRGAAVVAAVAMRGVRPAGAAL